MAQDIVSGLFGLSPNEVAQQQWMQTNQAADNFARLDPMQRSAQLLFKGGSGLAQAGAGMLGIPNPQIAEAEARQAAVSGMDMSSPESIMQRAAQIQDPRLKMQLMMTAQQLKAQQSEAAYKQAQAARLGTQQMLDMAQAQKALRENPNLTTAEVGVEGRPGWTQMVIYDKTNPKVDPIPIGAPKQSAAAMKIELGGIGKQKAPSGYMWGPDGTTLVAIPGGPADKPMTPAQQMKLQKEMATAGGALRTIKDTFFDVQNKAEELKKHPGLAGATGVRGMFPSIPGSQSGKVDALLKEFQSSVQKIGLEIVRAGGSIGQMTEKEWKIVEGMVANIDPVKLGKEGTIEQINKAVSIAEGMMNNAVSTYEERFGATPAPAAAPAALGAPPPGAVRVKPKGAK